jgi:nicotinamidase-related amidase
MLTFGGKQVCETLAEVVDPERAVLAVIDIENRSMWSEGSDRVVFDKVKELTVAARRIGMPVFFFYNHRNPGLTDISAAYIRVLLNLGHKPEELCDRFEPDFDEVRVHPGLEPQDGDFVIPKHRGCAFTGTDFELMLRTLQRESVVLVGCSTDWCLEATAWTATNRDYYVAVAEDCTRSPRPEGHTAALRQFRALGLDVTTSEQLLQLWSRIDVAEPA